MVDFKQVGKNAAELTKKAENEDIIVMFMGGRIRICPAGSFEDKSGKNIQYSARVKELGSLVDKSGNMSCSLFLSMIEAVTNNSDAMTKLKEYSA